MNSQQPLLAKQAFRHHKNIQQEGLISEVHPCAKSSWKCILFIFLTIISCGFVYLLSRWDLRVYIALRMRRCKASQASHLVIVGQDGTQTLTQINDQRCEYRLYKYIIENEVLEPIETDFQTKTGVEIRSHKVDREQAAKQFGMNSTEIPDKGIFVTLIEEVLSPFYIFQFCSVLLWFWAEYQKYATVILLTSLLSIIISLREQRRSFARLQQMSKFSTPVILENGSIVDSTQLVPGDRVQIQQSMTMPCDIILLQGQAIVNESMLTGESLPVLKSPVGDVIYNPLDEGKQSTLFAGTITMEANGIGMVSQIGFNTLKGQLIRSIMFPIGQSFQFYADSMKFVGIMAILAVVGFFVTIPNKIEYLQNGDITYWEFINEGLDLITITVPPALPTCLQIGVSIALARLQKYGIYCISPQKVNIAGKVTIMCFDKTGTLTEEGLDMYGVRTVINGHYDELNENKQVLQSIMASCHSLTWSKGQIIGDPLEIKMFNDTEWVLEAESDYLATVTKKMRAPQSDISLDTYAEPIFILKRFEFSSKLQRMSVIVQQGERMFAFMKGSPEKIRELCIPSSVPKDFHEKLDFYANSGFRVIALAQKEVREVLTREQTETKMNFLGLLIMENKLKGISRVVIQELHKAEIKTIMITGDNVLTAVSVARQCEIISKQRVYLGELSEKRLNGKYYVTWRDLDDSDSLDEDLKPRNRKESLIPADMIHEDEEIRHRKSMEDYTSLLKNKSLLEEPPPKSLSHIYTEGDFTEEQPWHDHEHYVLAISGGAFNHIVQNASQKTLSNILEKTVVYARMRPEEKGLLMSHLQKYRHQMVGFCGDGANDCAALKSADVGVSLSAAEASIAAPFTSKIEDISCIPLLLSQCRSALTTSFRCFKFMALYSMIQFTQVTILYLRQSNLTDNQYLYNDLFTIFPLSMTMALAKPLKLNKEVPGSALISLKVLGSVIGQTIIQLAFQLVVYFILLDRPWFYPADEVNKDDLNDDTMKVCFENTTLFIFANMQYIAVAIAFSVGRPFQEPFFKNFWMLVSILVLLALGLIFFFLRNSFTDDLMGFKFTATINGELVEMPQSWMNFLAMIALINAIVTLLFEYIVVKRL